MKIGLALVAFLVAVNVDCAAAGTFMGFQLNTKSPIRGLTVPLCADDTSIPSARLLIDEIRVEKRRVGNLIVGLMPRVEIVGMKLEIMENRDLNHSWSLLYDFAIREAAIKAADIKEFELFCQNKELPVIRAATARFNPLEATFQLQNVSVYNGEKLVKFIKVASIPLAGSHAGELLWKDGSADRNLPLGCPETANRIVTATTTF